MDINIISTTELQRNIKSVLERLEKNNKPLIVVKDSRPKAVMIRFNEYKRLSELEKGMLKKKMEEILEEMAKRNAKFSDEEIDRDIGEAVKYARSRS